jgi:hypothetical protein
MKRDGMSLVLQPKNQNILVSFSVPKTPRHVERELCITKLKMKSLLDDGLVKLLNPEARKGKFYILTNKAKRFLQLSGGRKSVAKQWGLIGWVLASPKQRLVVLKVLDFVKRTSEKIRERASRFNPCLTRISTKTILKELINRNLAHTEMNHFKRYYWISDDGLLVLKYIDNIETIPRP